MKLKVSKIAEFISAPRTASEQVACGYSIDSRSIQAGELFFAVKGERLDGHDAIEMSASRVRPLAAYATAVRIRARALAIVSRANDPSPGAPSSTISRVMPRSLMARSTSSGSSATTTSLCGGQMSRTRCN